MKTSYSQNNTYKNCPMHWHKNYVERYKSEQEGASLYFGSAVDYGVECMLKGHTDWLQQFYDRWNKAWAFGKSTQVFDNPNIIYGYKDFDEHVLEGKDVATAIQWAVDLGLKAPINRAGVVELYKAIAKTKKNPYKKATADQLKFFNKVSWLSMKRKGKLLLTAFHDQFLPKVTKVHATQKRADLKSPDTGDSIMGFIDMILSVEGYDKPVIFDLKTAAMPYKQEDLEFSEQLALYAAMKGQEYNTDLVGYVVLCKNIPKVSVANCKTCNHTKNSSHRTCNNEVNGVRCKGEWDEHVKCVPEVQVMVAEKSQEQISSLLMDVEKIVLAMKNNIVYKNTSKCNNWYGGVCAYYGACHKGDYSKLVKK